MTKKIFLINAINIVHASNSISIEYCFDNFKFADCSIGLSPFINSNLEFIGNASIQSNYFEHINGFINAEYSRSKSINLMAGLNFSYLRFNILIGASVKKEIYFQIKTKLINRKYEILNKYSLAYTFHKNKTVLQPDKTTLQLDTESTSQISKILSPKARNKKILKSNNTQIKSAKQKSQKTNDKLLPKSIPLSKTDEAKREIRKQELIKELFEGKEIIYLHLNTNGKKTAAIRIFYKMPSKLKMLKNMDQAINYIYFNHKQETFNGKTITNETAKKVWNQTIARINEITNNGNNEEKALQDTFENFSKLMDNELNTEDPKILSVIKKNKNFKHIYFGTETIIKRLNNRKKTDIKEATYQILRECLSKMRELDSIYKQEHKEKNNLG